MNPYVIFGIALVAAVVIFLFLRRIRRQNRQPAEQPSYMTALPPLTAEQKKEKIVIGRGSAGNRVVALDKMKKEKAPDSGFNGGSGGG